MIVALLLLAVFIGLFVRECRMEREQDLKERFMADLHMLKLFKKFNDEHDLDSTPFTIAIKELEEKIKQL